MWLQRHKPWVHVQLLFRRKSRQKLVVYCIIVSFSFVTFSSLWTWLLLPLPYVVFSSREGKFLGGKTSRKQLQLVRNCLQLPKINCQAAFLGSAKHLFAESRNSSSSLHEACDVLALAKDCSRMKSTLAYPDKPFSSVEKEFPLAYSIRMHRDPEQVEMLLRAIYSPQNLYCIYIDKKSPARVHQAMTSLAACFDNVFVASRLGRFYYATSSQMIADLQCMDELTRSKVQWKYYLNLAGQEFPLKTNREIVEVLRLLNGTNDIEVGKFRRGFQWRIINHVIPDEGEGFKFDGQKRDKLGLNITLHKGSGYGAFSRDFVEFLLTDPRVKRLRTWLLDTFAPEETLFATANTLSGAPGGYPVYVNQNAEVGQHISRVVVWRWTQFPRCQGESVRGVCILTTADLHWLVRRPQLFANKFMASRDISAVQCLLHRLLQKRTEIPKLDLKYFYSLPHVKYRIQRNL